MNYPVSTLSNGIRVASAFLKERKSVAIGIWVGIGGRDEESRLNGISHFIEHLVFKGTATRTANQIKEAIEGVGGSMNAFTCEEYTCFLAKVSRRHFEAVFNVLSDMVSNATLRQEDVEKERSVIIEEIKMTQDQPAQLVEESLSEIVWPGHPLGKSLAGTAQSVSGISREDLTGYYSKFYRPGFVTVTAAGDIDQESLVRIAELRFDGPKSSSQKSPQLFKSEQQAPALCAIDKSTEQTHLALAIRTFGKDHPDEHALDLLSVILGGNMSSRLFNEVREERGLAYDIGSFLRKYHETGALVVSAGTDHGKSAEALEVILREMKRMAIEPVPEAELRRAKDFYLGQLDLSLENSVNHMLWVGENLVAQNKIKTPEEVATRIESVSARDLMRVAAELFKTHALNLAIVGPAVSKAGYLSRLTF